MNKWDQRLKKDIKREFILSHAELDFSKRCIFIFRSSPSHILYPRLAKILPKLVKRDSDCAVHVDPN